MTTQLVTMIPAHLSTTQLATIGFLARYAGARHNHDRHANHVVAAFLVGGA